MVPLDQYLFNRYDILSKNIFLEIMFLNMKILMNIFLFKTEQINEENININYSYSKLYAY